jgi:hypothetical protein
MSLARSLNPHRPAVSRHSRRDAARGARRCDRANSGVSKSQLYHYFADKDALALEVINLQTERVLNAQQPHLDDRFHETDHMHSCHSGAPERSGGEPGTQ